MAGNYSFEEMQSLRLIRSEITKGNISIDSIRRVFNPDHWVTKTLLSEIDGDDRNLYDDAGNPEYILGRAFEV